MSPHLSTHRLQWHLRWIYWPVALLVAAVVVGQASWSTFTAKVTNSGNSLAVGTVNLTDDDAGSALFSASNLKPGSTGSQCIVVSSSGSLPSSVKLYTSGASTTKSLASYITVTITQGTGGSFGSCGNFTALTSGSSLYSGTLASLTSSATAFSNGLGNWSPNGNATENRTFQFGYTVSTSTPDTAQGGTAVFGFTWEAQNG